jgi:hypothetical protein
MASNGLKKILAHKSTVGSACDVRDIIEKKTGKHFIVSEQASLIGPEGCLFRYGNGFPLNYGTPDTEYNPASFCSLSANKQKFSKFAQEHDILSPIFYMTGFPAKYPVIVRDTLTGCGGEGIHIARDLQEFNKVMGAGKFWTPYFDNSYECRLYVVGPDISHAYYKVPFKEQENDDVKIRSDYHFSYVNPTGIFNGLRKIVRTIQENTGGKFFSIDAGWIPSLGRYIVFEINTGSWINSAIGDPLADYLIEKLNIA